MPTEEELQLDWRCHKLLFELGGIAGLGVKDKDTNKQQMYHAEVGDTQKGLDRAARICIMPPMSVEQWNQLLRHLVKCKSICFHNIMWFVSMYVVGCELDMQEKTTEYFRYLQRRQRRYSLEGLRAFQQDVLKAQVDTVKTNFITKQLILLHASSGRWVADLPDERT